MDIFLPFFLIDKPVRVKSYLLRLWRRQGRPKVVFDVIVTVTSCFFQADFTNSDLMVSGGVVRFDFATLVHSNEVLVGSGAGENVLDWDNREIVWKFYWAQVQCIVP